ncbi:MAG: NlpC/P60 family protein [Acidimicrobiales bacterium]|jgi:cell wall-associated NlpC family hydrolase
MPLKPYLRRNTGLVVAALLVASVALTSAVPSAGADQLANLRAQAQVIADKISALGQTEAALGEQYDGGVVALQQANARVAAAAKQLRGAEADQGRAITNLRQDAVAAYVGDGPQFAMSGSVPLSNLNDALVSQELEDTFASDQSDALDSYRLAAAVASTDRAQLVLARNAAAKQVARLEADRQRVQSAEDQLTAVQQGVKGQIETLVAQIQAEELAAEQRAEAQRLAEQRAAAAAAAAAAAQAAAAQAAAAAAEARQAQDTQTSSPPASSSTGTVDIPGVSAAASAAVQAAESRVGDPYVWGAAGPGEFDCSGLVMWAYAQAGVYLPHYSGSQYDDTVQIPMSDLEPGDLVFPADPGDHVAMYIGNGEIVQAPYTGADVQIIPLNPAFFVLATRVG